MLRLRFHRLTVEISYPLAAMMTAVILYDNSLSVVCCLMAVAMHESGHLIMLHRFGCMPERIRLTLFDIAIMDRSKALRGIRQELWVVLAGVAANIIVMAAVFPLMYFYHFRWAQQLFNADLTLALFNILPVNTLDGGQALGLILSSKLDIRTSLLIQDIVSLIIIIPLTAAGFLLLVSTRYNFSLLLTAVYLLALLLIKQPHIRKASKKRRKKRHGI